MTARQGELLAKPKRLTRGMLMHVCDVSGQSDGVVVQLKCRKCQHQSGWIEFRTVTEAKRGLPCAVCAA